MSKPLLYAVVYCEGTFAETYGKTAHGLVRFTRRYRIAAVIDSTLAGRDAGEFLDGRASGIPIVADLQKALIEAGRSGERATHFVVGIALEGRALPPPLLSAASAALDAGLNIDSGLHVFLSEIPELARKAQQKGLGITDIRKPPPREELHFFSGDIERVGARRIAVLGTDSAIGKRTTAWLLIKDLEKRRVPCELIGTGQTAWLQGARYSLVLDSLVNDFVAGEIENAVVQAWDEQHPEVIIIEGQGSLMNPAFPGGYEILAAARPHAVVLQHAPARLEYDGFPGFPLHPLAVQIKAIELISERPVVAISLNHQGLSPDEIPGHCRRIEKETGLPCADPLIDGTDRLIEAIYRADS